jgi:hypothetical protein
VGFLPDAGAARHLAQKIAQRESWRRDSSKITMPIPDEWLAAGCPPMRRVSLNGSSWQMDGPIVSLGPGGEAKLVFTAARIDRNGVSVLVMTEDIESSIVFEAEIISATAILVESAIIVEADISLVSDTTVTAD